jgi:hypothetical protein
MKQHRIPMLVFLLFGLSLSCGALLESNLLAGSTRSSIPWWDDTWLYRKEIRLNNASGGSGLTEFPLSLTLVNSVTNYDNFKSDGSDIRIVYGDQTTLLDYEIENWDPTGDSQIWVRLPDLSTNNSDKIWIYYGNDLAPAAENPTAVWDSNYHSVWHLNEFVSGEVINAGSGIADGVSVNMSAANIVKGAMGNAVQFIRSSSQWIDPEDPDPGFHHSAFTTKTISFWIKSDSTTGNQTIYETGGTTNGIYIAVSDGTLQYTTRDNSDQNDISTVHTDTSNFVFFTCVYDNTDMRLYRNGLQVDFFSTSYDADEVSSHAGDTGVGDSPDTNAGGTTGTLLFNGILDEIRWSTTARSAEWINAQYRSMNGEMTQFGEEEY